MALNVAPGLKDASRRTPINTASYQPPGGGDANSFFASLTPGTPVKESPGDVWGHDPAQGWYWGEGGPTQQDTGQPPSQKGPYPDGAMTNTRPSAGSRPSYAAQPLPQTSFQGYRAQTYTPYNFTTQAPGGYSAGTLNQFSAPDQTGDSNAIRAALQQALANPGFGDTAVAQMKGAHKEGVTDMQQQLAGQLQQSAASRGTLGGGAAIGAQMDLGQDAMSEILRGYRDIDISAADRKNADLLNAIGAGNAFLSGEADRASGLYRTGLEGQLAQEGLKQAESQSGFDRAALMRMLENDRAAEGRYAAEFGADEAQKTFDNQFKVEDAALRRALAADDQARFAADFGQRGYETDLDAYLQERGQDIDKDLEGRRLDIQNILGTGGLDIDRARLTESGRQFDQSHLLDLLSFLENQRQFNRRLGYDYTGLGLGANQDFFNSLLRGS